MSALRTNGVRALIALSVAFGLWVIVGVLENPTEQSRHSNLISTENMPSGLVIVDDAGRPVAALNVVANVTVSAPREVLSTITRSNIQPYIDLSGYDSGTYNVPVQVHTPPRVQILSLDPEQIQVRLERAVTNTVPLEVNKVGQPPFSFEAGEPVTTLGGLPITQVTVSGPDSQVRHVVRATIELNVANQTSDIRSQRQPVAINASGQRVEGVLVTPESVDVSLRIISSAGVKRVPILPRWSGIPAPGAVLTRITSTPDFVGILANALILDEVSYIETEAVDISGQSESFTRTVDLRLPPGATLLGLGPKSVQVEVSIEPVELDFSLSLKVPVVARNLAPELTAVVEPQLISITISGRAQSLQSLGPDLLRAAVDLRGLGVGSHSVTPVLSLPSGISLTGELDPVLVTLRLIPSPTPLPPPSATPELPSLPPLPSPTTVITPTETITATPEE
jgi:YbbR domain-containing protein